MNGKSANNNLFIVLIIISFSLRLYLRFNKNSGLEPCKELVLWLIVASLIVKLSFWLFEKYNQRKVDNHL